MPYTLVFTPEAEEQLATIYRYIATVASPNTAERYTNAVIYYCEGLTTFPIEGTTLGRQIILIQVIIC